MSISPNTSKIILRGSDIVALVAREPSPVKPLSPDPTTVLITPVRVSTFLTRKFHSSTIYISPIPSNVTSPGEDSFAVVASIPSPL